jgi:hypothetical protein
VVKISLHPSPTPYVDPIPPKTTQCHPRLRASAEGRNPKTQTPGLKRPGVKKQIVDRRLGPHQARFWLDGVEKPSPAMFEAVIWTLQTKIEYTLSYFLFSHNKKIATLCQLYAFRICGTGTLACDLSILVWHSRPRLWPFRASAARREIIEPTLKRKRQRSREGWVS